MLGLALAVAPSAFAAERFATPTGAGADPCNPTPCSLETAIEDGTDPADEVIVAPGDYAVGAAVLDVPGGGVVVHGVAGMPRPRILSTAAGAAVTVGAGNIVRRLAIEHSGTSTTVPTSFALALTGGGSKAEQIVRAQRRRRGRPQPRRRGVRGGKRRRDLERQRLLGRRPRDVRL